MKRGYAAGVTAAVMSVTVALMSKRVRSVLRRVVASGAADVRNAGETFTSAATEVAHGAERVAGNLTGELVGEAQQVYHGADATTTAPATKPSSPSASSSQSRSTSTRA